MLIFAFLPKDSSSATAEVPLICVIHVYNTHTHPCVLQKCINMFKIRYDTIQYDILFALKNWRASCQFNLAHQLKEN